MTAPRDNIATDHNPPTRRGGLLARLFGHRQATLTESEAERLATLSRTIADAEPLTLDQWQASFTKPLLEKREDERQRLGSRSP